MQLTYKDALQCAPDLRILHLRQNNMLHRSGYPELEGISSQNTHVLTLMTHRWANAFFDYMHRKGWSQRLHTLVIRCFVAERDDMGDDYIYSPQHCFVKGLQTDMYGRSFAMAIPVSRSRVKAELPWTDILDHDPECDWIGNYRTT